MTLSFSSRTIGDVTVLTCDGRIVEGAESATFSNTHRQSFWTSATFTSSTAAASVCSFAFLREQGKATSNCAV